MMYLSFFSALPTKTGGAQKRQSILQIDTLTAVCRWGSKGCTCVGRRAILGAAAAAGAAPGAAAPAAAAGALRQPLLRRLALLCTAHRLGLGPV